MSNIAIRVESLSKQFYIGDKQEKYKTLRDSLMAGVSGAIRRTGSLFSRHPSEVNRNEEIWALKDLVFKVDHGEVLGIIGHNGAGKSTLLKILSRITEPTKGYVDIYGRVGALLEVGTGFHPELTGRENIYLNGAILGMLRSEIDKKFDEIVDFSGIEKFIDTPVKHYSSGMGLRLGFAVAAHLEPEILLIDEVLAVGDAAFQRKCLGKIENVSHSGRTVLFVSHNLATVNALCERCILLDQGQIKRIGATDEIISLYSKSGIGSSVELGNNISRTGDCEIRFERIKIQDTEGNPLLVVSSGSDICIELDYSINGNKFLYQVEVAIFVRSFVGENLFICHTRVVNENFDRFPPGYKLVCTIPRLPLPPGFYVLGLWSQVGSQLADSIENAMTLEVVEGDFYGTGRLPARKHRGVLVDYHWSLSGVQHDPLSLTSKWAAKVEIEGTANVELF